MKKRGLDSTDLVEPPLSGDTTFEEAQKLAEGELTLFGNVCFNDFEHTSPSQIRQHVKEIFKNGNRRIVLTSASGPVAAVNPKLLQGYRAFIETSLEYGS